MFVPKVFHEFQPIGGVLTNIIVSLRYVISIYLSGTIPVGIYVSISGNQCQVKIIFLRKNFGLPIITVIFLRKRRFGACSGSKKRRRNNGTAEEGATNPPFSSVKGFNILYIEKNRPAWYTLYCGILYINDEFPHDQMIPRGRG